MILVGAVVLVALGLVPQPWGLVLIAGAVVAEVAESLFWWWLSRRGRPAVGAEALVGQSATVLRPCRPVGQVRVLGEIWRARCDGGADRGERVLVRAVEGLALVVERASPDAPASGGSQAST